MTSAAPSRGAGSGPWLDHDPEDVAQEVQLASKRRRLENDKKAEPQIRCALCERSPEEPCLTLAMKAHWRGMTNHYEGFTSEPEASSSKYSPCSPVADLRLCLRGDVLLPSLHQKRGFAEWGFFVIKDVGLQSNLWLGHLSSRSSQEKKKPTKIQATNITSTPLTLFLQPCFGRSCFVAWQESGSISRAPEE